MNKSKTPYRKDTKAIDLKRHGKEFRVASSRRLKQMILSLTASRAQTSVDCRCQQFWISSAYPLTALAIVASKIIEPTFCAM